MAQECVQSVLRGIMALSPLLSPEEAEVPSEEVAMGACEMEALSQV